MTLRRLEVRAAMVCHFLFVQPGAPKPSSSGWLQNKAEIIKSKDQVKLIQTAMGLEQNGIVNRDSIRYG
jgi:hypothetical protein